MDRCSIPLGGATFHHILVNQELIIKTDQEKPRKISLHWSANAP
jgi:hypothetical protein